MKLLPIVLLNVITVTVGIIVYEHVRDDGPTTGALITEGGTDLVEVTRRLEALESRQEPALRATGSNSDLLDRIAALEAARTSAEGAVKEEAFLAKPTEAEQPGAGPTDPKRAWKEITKDEIARFRKLRDAAARQDRVKRNAKRVDGALKKLGLDLSTSQRERIHERFAAFQPEIDRIWTEAKTQAQATVQAGGTIDRGEIVTSTRALIQQSFAETINDIVPQADAEAVATSLLGGGK